MLRLKVRYIRTPPHVRNMRRGSCGFETGVVWHIGIFGVIGDDSWAEAMDKDNEALSHGTSLKASEGRCHACR